MQREYEIVIADTSCFILLDNIDELQILKLLFGHVITTSIIAEEFGSSLPEWIEIRTVKDIDLFCYPEFYLAIDLMKSMYSRGKECSLAPGYLPSDCLHKQNN